MFFAGVLILGALPVGLYVRALIVGHSHMELLERESKGARVCFV